MPAARSQDEILARFREVHSTDTLGWRREVLVDAMTADTLRTAMPGIEVADDWQPADNEADARKYLAFAITKIVGHRGISANRSVEKLATYAWLLGRDDVVEAMGKEDYPQYGAPQVRAFADGMGWPFLDAAEDDHDRAALERMARGEPCDSDGCYAGCGR